MDSESQKKLLRKAGSFLSRRPHSRGELRQKLARRAEPADIEAVLVRLDELHLLNDEEYAYNFAFRRSEQDGWGPMKIRAELMQRQIPPELIDRAIERVQQEIDSETALKTCWEKIIRKEGVPGDRKAARRLIQKLRRRGHGDDVIIRLLRRHIPRDAWPIAGD
jgi:regulatory protein